MFWRYWKSFHNFVYRNVFRTAKKTAFRRFWVVSPTKQHWSGLEWSERGLCIYRFGIIHSFRWSSITCSICALIHNFLIIHLWIEGGRASYNVVHIVSVQFQHLGALSTCKSFTGKEVQREENFQSHSLKWTPKVLQRKVLSIMALDQNYCSAAE